MASGGHEPENLLRDRMREWGLVENDDFNSSDVVVVDSNHDTESKTRAYDFVLPYRTSGWSDQWNKRLFIQCQFYAGDSGSVSHKNVDQTNSSRTNVLSFAEDAKFLEYVDGAGYFSSLNGDLKRLLNYQTTRSFFQVRSAPIRLRRELQELGYLVPLEIEHAICATDGKEDNVREKLEEEGYQEIEVERCLSSSKNRKVIEVKDSEALEISQNRRDLVRRYLLLDVVASCGETVKDASSASGKILIPGYGPFYGMPLDELASQAARVAPRLRTDINNSQLLLGDIRWLCEQKMAMAR